MVASESEAYVSVHRQLCSKLLLRVSKHRVNCTCAGSGMLETAGARQAGDMHLS
jgi:hypothetical protein